MKVVFLGLSITSSWGNGHATNYRALVRELDRRGHDVLFCERDKPWYAAHRDLPELPHGRLCLYGSVCDLIERASTDVHEADLVVLGSYVPDGVAVADWALETATGLTAFYDIDTPVTVAKLAAGDHEYLAPRLVPRFDLYLSFTGGPTLALLEERFGARRALAFYCLVDADAYRPVQAPARWDLGYLGTYSEDRQPLLEELLLAPARAAPERHFVVAGPSYPAGIRWPENVERIEHLPPDEHPAFYAAQRYTLNVTRRRMREAGWSPSVRLFEAAACGVPIITDVWPGLEECLMPGQEILQARGCDDVLRALRGIDERRREAIARRARWRVLREHTAAHRVDLLEREVAAPAGVITRLAAPAGAAAPVAEVLGARARGGTAR
jgi:spore maturation protein CgeB